MIKIGLLLFHLLFALEKPSVLITMEPQLPADRVIYLEDLAEVKGLEESVKKNVQKIVLSLTSVEYAKKSKIELLKTLRAELAPFEQECGCDIQLVFARQKDSAKDLEFSLEKVKQVLLSRLQESCSDCVYQVSNLNILRGQMPKDFSKWNLQEDLRDLRGAAMLRVYFDDQFLNPMVLQGWVRVQRPVVTLKKALAKGSVPNSEDYSVLLKDVTHENKVYSAVGDLLDKELKRSLNEGHDLTLDDLLERQIVKMGAPIAVEIKNGAISVEMTGVAQKSGKLGDRIPIRITKTQKQMTAEIIAESRVRSE